MSINPFDEIALEEGLRIRERQSGVEVVAVSAGGPDTQPQLRTALAMGADRAVLIETGQALEPLAVAHALRVLVDHERPDLVLLGKQAIDDDLNQTGQMLAALWGRPQATFASKVDLGDGVAVVEREVDDGLETVEVDLPAVITADLRLNEPRYVKLPDILKAKRKPLEVLSLESLGIDAQPQFRPVLWDVPAQRAPGMKVADVTALIDELRKRGAL